jgi:hypothetical protein
VTGNGRYAGRDMRVPDENLDDFNISSAPKTAEPPAVKLVHPSGEIEVLKPLARWEGFVKSEAATGGMFHRAAPHWPSWFRRSLAVGGAVAIIALILGTGIYVGIYRPPVEPVVSKSDVAIDQQPESALLPPDEPSASDLLPTADSPGAFDELYAVGPVKRSRHLRPRTGPRQRFAFSILNSRFSIASHHRRPLLRPQLIVSAFIPTTLIIYIENGEIKTRIEPQLTAGYKKPVTLSN